MKLCRYGKNGFEKPGIIDAEGRLRDLSKVVENIGPKELAPRGLKMLAKVNPRRSPWSPTARGWACPSSASASSSPSA